MELIKDVIKMKRKLSTKEMENEKKKKKYKERLIIKVKSFKINVVKSKVKKGVKWMNLKEIQTRRTKNSYY